MSIRTCEVPQCTGLYLARGYCKRHYTNWRRYGRAKVDYEWRRFWAKVDTSGDCWLWTASRSGGYGRFSGSGHNYAHRWVWETLVGPIPDGGTIDHLCKVRHCVNPDHLEVVSMTENLRRGWSPSSRNRIKSACKYGHPLDGDNLYVNPTDGKRSCRICNKAKDRRHKRRRAL